VRSTLWMPGPLGQLITVFTFSTAYSFGFSAGIVSASPLADVALTFATLFYFFGWIAYEARSSRYFPSHAYVLWLAMAAPLLIPHFLFRTRGTAGVPFAVLIVLLLVSPLAGAVLGEMASPHVPEIFWITNE